MRSPISSSAGFAAATPDKPMLIAITATLLLSWLLMISQAMESMTRAFYARSDLDLILASPVAAQEIFAVRIVDGRAFDRGDGAAARGAVHRHVGRAWRMALARRLRRDRRHGRGGDRACGRAHGRAVSQHRPEAHASRGAGSRRGDRRRFRDRLAGGGDPVLRKFVAQRRAAIENGARDIAGRRQHAVVAGSRGPRRRRGSASVLGVQPRSCSRSPSRSSSPRFGEYAIAAAGVGDAHAEPARRAEHFSVTSPRRALRRKEWMLLRRDPWLVSQTLMQMLYLLPPAVLLWRSFEAGGGALNLLVPVLVMAAGQLAGGLAWLTISGEDAPDLVATAPVPTRFVLRAKVEAVLGDHRAHLRAARRGDRLRRRRGMLWSPASASSLPRRRRPPSSCGSAPRPSAASSAGARSPRGSRRLPRRFPRSAGRRPPGLPPSVCGLRSRRL